MIKNKVLIIEDDEDLREGLSFSFMSDGYEVQDVGTKKEGLKEIQKNILLSRKLNDALSSRLFYAHFDSHRDISHFKSSCFCELFF